MLLRDPRHSEADPVPRDLARRQLLHRQQRRAAIPLCRKQARLMTSKHCFADFADSVSA